MYAGLYIIHLFSAFGITIDYADSLKRATQHVVNLARGEVISSSILNAKYDFFN